MKRVWLFAFVIGCLFMDAYAVLGTEWKNGETTVIDSQSGSGAITPDIAEGTTTGLPTLTIAGDATYTITSQTPADIFEINTNTGALTLAEAQVLDYETATTHVITIEASEGQTTGTATITITISDVNDNGPTFPPALYKACLVDNTAADVSVLTVSTTDDVDTTTAFNTISAMTLAAGNTNTDFKISTAGVLKTAKALNMSNTASYVLRVEAKDSATGDTQLTGTTSVVVLVDNTCGPCNSVTTTLVASMTAMLAGLLTALQ